MNGESWNIYWNEYAKDMYLYGTEAVFHSFNDVEFRNQLMPPGTVIKKWYSKTNYQLMQIEPSLPLIDGEGRYKISMDVSCIPEGGLLIKLLYLDRYDSEVGFQIIRDSEGEFQCPLNTYSYQLHLISAGTTEFRFHSIKITEIIDE